MQRQPPNSATNILTPAHYENLQIIIFYTEGITAEQLAAIQ